ncbi:MAG: geranylgeranylglycerol-phosphate geranylgeranyltransferase [Candidatus Latescibacterota bacterium]|nr:MAG: geranylgeranylglycerol-phosphate geranylgeranyltransferase [Candidatus Latescibacterota bacterium]
MMGRVAATFEIARPHNMIVAAMCVYASYYLCGGTALSTVLPALVFTALVTGLGNLVNDYFDSGIDRINKPRRPIPSGRLSPRYVLTVYVLGTAVVTAAMVLFLRPSLLILLLCWETAVFVYAAWAKRVTLLGNVVIAGVCSSAFLAGALITGDYAVVAFPVCFAFLFVLGRELIKGAEDIRGDSLAGAATVAVRFGAERAAFSGAMLLFVCTLIAPLPALVHYFGRTYGLLMELLVVPGMLVAAYLVLRFPGRATFNRVSWILKIEMFVGVLVLGLGRV